MLNNQTKNCSICQKIIDIKKNKNPYFVSELSTGYIVLGSYQFYRGYTLFLCKKHSNELHELPSNFRQQFLKDMSLVAEAVFKAFKPRKLNYELLGNTTSHLHWHLFPRYKNDPVPQRPIWCIDSSITCSDKVRPTPKQIKYLKAKLIKAMNEIKRVDENKRGYL